jgi:hypothetical protein
LATSSATPVPINRDLRHRRRRADCALVEFGVAYFEKSRGGIALGLSLGDILGARTSLQQREFLSRVGELHVGGTGIALHLEQLRARCRHIQLQGAARSSALISVKTTEARIDALRFTTASEREIQPLSSAVACFSQVRVALSTSGISALRTRA